MSISNEVIVDAFRKGYRIAPNGTVLSPKGKERKTFRLEDGHLSFNVCFNKQTRLIKVHRLAAFQKFGNNMFAEGVEVRHLDGNPANNDLANIAIGSHSDNMMDMRAVDRRAKAQKAANARRKLSDDEVRSLRQDRADGYTYDQLCQRYGISKSTISYVVNRKTYTNVG